MPVAQPIVVRLDAVDYMLGPSYDFPTGLVDHILSPNVIDPSSPTPVTIFAGCSGFTEFRQSWLDERFEDMIGCDDVWCKSFTKNVIIQTDTHKIFARLNDEKFEKGSNGPLRNRETVIPEGPYFLLKSKLYQALRLYPDPLGAFVCGVVPNAAATSLSMATGTEAASFQAITHGLIPVPTRLGFKNFDPAVPLAGRRIAVKDIFDLKGVKTTLCSKANEELQDAARTTATCIQKLIDQGAIIVGKLKTSPFASGMGPRDWVDYQPPFNPRGDGYLDSGCSSAGSGAALAGYEWLDIAIGSDTLGSMVGPASLNGLFGLRPSHGRLSCDGALPVSPHLDTPGNFSRKIGEFSNFTRLWLSDNLSTKEMATVELKIPKKLVVPPERFRNYVPGVLNVMEQFIQDFERVTGATRTAVTMEDLWASKRPSNFAGKSFLDTFGTTLAHLQLYGHYHNTIKYREDYKKKFGRELYAEPLLSYKWDLGAKLTAEQYAEALAEKQVFSDFLKDHIFDEGGVMLLPCSAEDVAYRDTYDGSVEECGSRWQGFNIPETAFSGLGGGPAVAFPAGHRLYMSKITKVEEYQPVGLMLLGAPGKLDEYMQV
ncbi:hypothetical protein ACMFMG_007239 [Clarireedia jacksonii]